MDSKRFCFIVEWYDNSADLKRLYQLFYYMSDGSVEMYDVKNRRLFVSRTKVDLLVKDLYIGNSIKVLSRELNITDYGDHFTREKLGDMNESTFGMIKPDALSNMGSILDIIYGSEFIVKELKMVQLSPREAAEFYQEHRDRHFYDKLISFITSGPVIVFVLMGTDAVKRWRSLLGPTDTAQAKVQFPASIRARYGTDNTKNACHGSDSTESAIREINFFFSSSSRGCSTFKNRPSTCCIIKPHAVTGGSAGNIIKAISQHFEISSLEMFNIGKANAEEFYEIYKGTVNEYSDMVSELASGSFFVLQILQVREDDIVKSFRQFCGPSNPQIATHLRKGTLRANFGVDMVKNAVHCTDLSEDGDLEVEYFFKILKA